MQKTLFVYIFRDLLRVFLLASGALAGIMSFGGLLRPLTQHNLAMGQVAQMLGYFMPAMTNYSWPIAALFATTFVYGRLSADNELTACRAAGLSYLHILIPAGVLGSLVTILSVFFLCYVVPHSFLKAEKVVYSNLAQLVAGQIDRTQRISLNSPTQSVTIFARSAEVLERNAINPGDQAVELHDVAIVSYANEKEKDQPKIPKEFYMADTATALIQMPRDVDGDVLIRTMLTNGDKIPRAAEGGKKSMFIASFDTSSAGPFPLQSPVRETARFMDINRLLDLRNNPEKSRRITKQLSDMAAVDQKHAYAQLLYNTLRSGQPIVLHGTESGRDVTYTIDPPRSTASARPGYSVNSDQLTVTEGTIDRPGVSFRGEGSASFTGRAREIVLTPTPNSDTNVVFVKLEVKDAVLLYREEESPLQSKEWNLAVPMPESVAQLAQRKAVDYFSDPAIATKERVGRLKSDFTRQRNQIESELHARFGFAFSCFVLALVGAAIGMLFKSGNFVSAFAVSVGPALVSIVLIVIGQHICETVPREIGKTFHDPLNVGITVLWLGNVLVVALGLGLYRRLSRT